jgi:hypothetical protein
LDACFIVTDSAEELREMNLMIKPLCHVLFAGALCLVGIDNINSANAQQTDQQTIVPKAEAALAAKIKCRDFRKNANGTWTSHPNTKIGANAFPAHTFDTHGVSIGGADLATVLNRKCGVAPQVRPQNRPSPSKPTETPGQISPEPSPPANSQESPQPNGDEQTPDGSR